MYAKLHCEGDSVMHGILKYGLFLFILNTVSALAAADTCDAILSNQINFSKEASSLDISMLNIVNEENFSEIKRKAEGSAYGNLFSGSYEDFTKKRALLYTKMHFSYTTAQSREIFKSSLSDTQISAWSECMHQNNKIAIYYKDVTNDSATLVVEWFAPSEIGPLKDTHIQIVNAASRKNLNDLKTFQGTRRIIIEREDANLPIRGLIEGRAGISRRFYSADFFIAPQSELTSPSNVQVLEATEPQKLVVQSNGLVLRSIAWWAHWRRNQSWDCIAPQPGMKLVSGATTTRNLGHKKGQCVGEGSYCDSTGEYCQDIVITSGCYINADWLDWYNELISSKRLAFSVEQVCQPRSTNES